jgi:hypothetical protein
MLIDQPAVITEVEQAFAAYEAALLRNDAAALDAFFWDDPRAVRYGVAEHGYGIAAIRAWRAQYAGVDPRRQLRNTVITAIGAEAAAVSTEFFVPGETTVGRQTQTWARLATGWRIVAAHVSVVDGDQLTVY